MTLRSRVAWAAAGSTALVAVTIAAVGIVSVRHVLRDQVDRAVTQEAERVVRRLHDGGADNRVPPAGATRAVRVFTTSGHVVDQGSFPTLALTPGDLVAASGARRPVLRDATVGGEPVRVATVSAGEVDGRRVGVQVARAATEIEESVQRLTLVFGVTGALGVAIALALGWAVARSAVRPVTRLAAAAAHVADTEDLSVTVPETGGDEIEGLASSFNRMLRTLGESRAEQRRLVADASHELRTPLTSLRTNVEVLGAAEVLDPADRDALMVDVTAQVEELAGLVADLVELARGDEVHAGQFVDVDLDAVVEQAVERARRRRDDVEVVADLEPTPMRGMPVLLERAVLNLLDNAVKWSPPAGTVTVRLHGRRLVVDDDGPGIRAEDRPHVTERFWRAADARSTPGSGLGLAIVDQVVRAHGATMSVGESASGGASVAVAW